MWGMTQQLALIALMRPMGEIKNRYSLATWPLFEFSAHLFCLQALELLNNELELLRRSCRSIYRLAYTISLHS